MHNRVLIPVHIVCCGNMHGCMYVYLGLCEYVKGIHNKYTRASGTRYSIQHETTMHKRISLVRTKSSVETIA